MSGAITATGVLATAAAVGTAYSIYQGQQSASAQRDAQRQALAQAERQRSESQQAYNKANQKAPNVASIMDAAAAGGGGSGTMLTSPTGIDPNELKLGKSTLLGS